MFKLKISYRNIFLLTSLAILLCFGGVVYGVVSNDAAGQEPEYVPGEILVKFKEGADPQTVLQSLNLESANVSRVHSIKPAVAKFKKDYKLEKTEDGWYSFLGKNYKEVSDIQNIPDEEVFKEAYIKMPDAEKDIYRSYKLKLAEGLSVPEAIGKLRENPDVEYAEPNYIRKIQAAPNDPYYSSSGSWGQTYDDLWGIKKIRCEEAWDKSKGKGVVVAVIDTGVDYNHPDIAGNIWINTDELPANGKDDDNNGYADDVSGWNFALGNDSVMDDNGHGTHCAGTIAAVGDNGIGIVGVAPEANIMIVKGFDGSGNGNDDVLARCVKYAADNGANVLSCSWGWGGKGGSGTLADAFNYAHSRGCISVAAAGNSDDLVEHYFPASFDSVITVAATGPEDIKNAYSNYGEKIDVTAPGGGGRGWEFGIDARAATGEYYATPWPKNYADSNWTHFSFGKGKKYLIAASGPDCGIVDVEINGYYHRTIDLYAPEFTWQSQFPIDYDDNAQLIFRVTGDKNPESTGTYFLFQGVRCGDKIFGPGYLAILENPWDRNTDVNILSLRSDNNGSPTGDEVQVVGEKYYRKAGTSMACPHVAGLAALLLSAYPKMSPGQVESRIIASADPIDLENPYRKYTMGSGRINASNAINGTNLHPHLALQSVSCNTPVPGGTGSVSISIKNKGAKASGVACALVCDDPLVHINKGRSSPFTFELDNAFNFGKPIEFKALITADGGYYREARFKTAAYTPMMAGWPYYSELGHAQNCAPILTDLNNDRRKEIVVYTTNSNTKNLSDTLHNYIFVLNPHGKKLNNNWPLVLDDRIVTSVASGDINGDKFKELVIDTVARPLTFAPAKTMFLDIDAQPVGAGQIEGGSADTILDDINKDGRCEVIKTDIPYSGAGIIVTVYDYMGNIVMQAQDTSLRIYNMYARAVGDVDGDGYSEIVCAYSDVPPPYREVYTGGLCIVRRDGTVRSFPVKLNPRALTLGDINGDGALEMVIAGESSKDAACLIAVDSLGNELWRRDIGEIPAGALDRLRYPYAKNTLDIYEPAICDIDGDKNPEVLYYGRVRATDLHRIFAFKGDGSDLGGSWPAEVSGFNYNSPVFTSPVVGDVDGDKDMEVFFTSFHNFEIVINGWNQDGTRMANWPLYAGSYLDDYMRDSGNVALGDIDGDGKAELVAVNSGDVNNQFVSVNVYKLGRCVGGFDWPMYRHDEQHTGRYLPHQPVMDPIGDKTVNREEWLRFKVLATDPGDDLIRYSITNKPRGAHFSERTGEFIWRPDIYQAGSFKVTFTAIDPKDNRASQTITITVPNQPPVLNPIGNKTIKAGQLLRFKITAKDPDAIDNPSLRFYSNDLPKGADLSHNGIFTWVPTKKQVGAYKIKIYIKDPPGLTDEETITVSVR